MRNHNPNTRALTSAMRCELAPLRAAAVAIIDGVVKGAKSPTQALVVGLDTSWTTATSLVREREKLTKSGKRRKRP